MVYCICDCCKEVFELEIKEYIKYIYQIEYEKKKDKPILCCDDCYDMICLLDTQYAGV